MLICIVLICVFVGYFRKGMGYFCDIVVFIIVISLMYCCFLCVIEVFGIDVVYVLFF